MTAPNSKATNNPRIFRIKKVISKISGAILPVCTIVVTTESTAMARISSTIAAPKINLVSLVCIFPSSDNTWTDTAMLVAVKAVATSTDSNAAKPKSVNA